MTRKSDTSSFFCFTYFRQLSMKDLISACEKRPLESFVHVRIKVRPWGNDSCIPCRECIPFRSLSFWNCR